MIEVPEFLQDECWNTLALEYGEQIPVNLTRILAVIDKRIWGDEITHAKRLMQDSRSRGCYDMKDMQTVAQILWNWRGYMKADFATELLWRMP